MNFATAVLVQGCGPIGLSIIIALKVMGTLNIIAMDEYDIRLETAVDMGATVTLNPGKFDNDMEMINGIKAITKGKGGGLAFLAEIKKEGIKIAIVN